MIKRLVDSFNYAISGIVEAVKKEKHMKIHITVAIIVLTVCFFYDLSKIELLIITGTISLVIITEMINTSIEFVLNAIYKEYNENVKRAKDICAGAVLIAVINSVTVGYIIFGDRLQPITYNVLEKIKASNIYIIFIILIIVVICILLFKIKIGTGTPLMGGMPSGHSAVAFSIATMIGLITEDLIGIILGFMLAIIVAQSRIDSKVHSIIEVILGSVLGFLITLLLYKLIL